LQEHEIDKVGGREPIPVDVRVIATTNKDPKSLINDHKFREDLYYRLNVIPLKVPPLRERMEDIPLLAQHFIEKHSKANGKEVKGIADETVALLKKYQWRGNIREMENIIERAVLLCQGETILPSNLFMDEDSESQTGANDKPLSNFRGTIYQMEKELIQQTLVEVDGNKTRAAEALGISIRTLRNKLTEYREKDQNQ
jgi:transcriptional regulator with PAS, ATPase and Fis domain